ncbi:MAG: GAF domain-containing protein, partial [Flammeovirgaceae bacterium]
MAEQLIIDTTQDKATRYQALLPQIEGLIAGEKDEVANLANIAAALKEAMGFFWVGFYVVKNTDAADSKHELVLGPFQGPIACTRFGFGKGVC